MEAEYVAMSVAMKDIIPLQCIVQTIIEAVGLDTKIRATIKNGVLEDITGVLILPNLSHLEYLYALSIMH